MLHQFATSLVQSILSGILIGGVYGLFSTGFSLAFGVMRIVNFAHGELVMIGMYIGLFIYNLTGIDPLYSMPISGAAVAAMGALLYLGLYRKFVGRATLQQLLMGIAIALILQVLMQIAFGPETRGLQSVWGSRYLLLGPIFLSYAQIVAFVLAVIIVALVEGILSGTQWGKSIRAIADDMEASELVGVDAQRMNVGAFALACGLAGIAGGILVTYFPVSPTVGFTLIPIALIAMVLGGVGSVGGTFVGGILAGIVQQMTGLLWNTALQNIPLYILLLLFLGFRPYGLFGRHSAH
jgi:branched-chain amino acid transport system permease protein